MITRLALWSMPFLVGLGIAYCGAQLGASTSPPVPNFAASASVTPTRTMAAPTTAHTPRPGSAKADTGDRGLAPETAASAADFGTPLGKAFPERVLPTIAERRGAAPVRLSIPSLDVDGAPVEPVGLEPSGELEVPGASAIGWYRFGSPIGSGQGSTVLAAHIAFNGVDGVFRNLDDLEVGETVSVASADGSVEFVVSELVQYDKFELPIDDLFREDGEERLVMITCGGSFNPDLRTYDDNVVAIAVPAND